MGLKNEEKLFINEILNKFKQGTNIDFGYKREAEKRIFKNFLFKNIKKNILEGIIKKNIFQKYCGYSESFYGMMKEYKKINENLDFWFLYQRDDIEFKSDNFIKLIYNIDLKNKTNGFFLTCGMASIFDVLSILNNLLYKKILCTFRPYFETIDIFNNFNYIVEYLETINKNIEQNIYDILYIDSSSPDFDCIDYKKVSVKTIVCDTSCLSPLDPYIKNLVFYANENNIPLFLVRSNLKIDCFGLEINRLGSVVIICDNNDKFIQNIKNIARINGNKSELNHIYPWLGNNIFFELIDKKVKRVQNITNIIKNYCKLNLSRDKYNILEFKHNLYFTIIAKNYDNSFNFDLMEKTILYCNEFVNFFKLQNFFLEYPGISNYNDFLDKKWHYRITSADIDEKDAKIIAKMICKVFNSF